MTTPDPKLLANVQGDILLDGLPKRNESFFLFTIADGQVQAFCQSLPNLAGLIADSRHTQEIRAKIKKFKEENKGKDADTIPTVGACVAFTRRGLDKMDTFLKTLKVGSMGDAPFNSGMRAVAKDTLQDPIANGQPKYEPAFNSPEKLHGVVLVAGNTPQIVENKLADVKKALGATVKEVATIKGKVRPGEVKGHEHFGYEDGISQPAVKGVDTAPIPQQGTIRQGIALCGREGDEITTRPEWMKDGSFMCFRKLQQNVQDWDKMLQDVSNQIGTFSDQLGARLIGRWKSGCPVALSPDFDNKTIAADPKQNNNFIYEPGKFAASPAGAHIRKTFPRGDLGDVNSFSLERSRILRRGIPYGDEIAVSPTGERGLLFVCYQSNLSNGFQFIQQTWANNQSFIDSSAGLDITIGQSNNDADGKFEMLGLMPANLSRPATFQTVNRFVVPKGGEYFFMPSMTALKTTLAGKAVRAEL